MIAFKLADVKPESSEAYLLKLVKNLSVDFEVMYIFHKNVVLNKLYVDISKVFIPTKNK